MDARGEPTRITGDDDPDLWWALRGAGGDLGIATAVEIDLLPLDGLYGLAGCCGRGSTPHGC